MKSKLNIVILIGIVGVISFIFYDFIKSSQEEKSSINNQVINEKSINDNKFTHNQDVDYTKETGVKGVKYGSDVGDMVYDYEFINIQTDEVVRMSDFRGKKVLLNFWVSWCPPCKQEAPHLQEFHEEEDDVVILGINVQSAERNEGAEFDFVDNYGLTFDNFYAPDEMYHMFPIVSFPTSILVNSDGIIEEGVVGAMSVDLLKNLFDAIE